MPTPEEAVAVAARFFDRMGHFDWEAMGACVAEDVARVGPYRDQKAGHWIESHGNPTEVVGTWRYSPPYRRAVRHSRPQLA